MHGADKLIGGAGNDSLLGDNADKDPNGGTGTDTWQAGPTTAGGVNITSNDLEKVDTTGNDANEATKLKGDYQPGPSDGWKFGVVDPGVAGPFGSAATQFVFDDKIDLSGWTGDGTSGVQIVTGGGTDFLIGSGQTGTTHSANDVLQGGAGNDTLVGLRGRDYLGGDADLDTPDSGADGNDLISGGGDADLIDGGGDGTVKRNDNNIGIEWNGDTLSYHTVVVRFGDVDRTFPGSPASVIVSLEGFLDFFLTTGDINNDTVKDTGPDYGRGGDAEGDVIVNQAGGISGTNDVIRPAGGLDSSIENLIGSDFDDRLWLDGTPNGAHGKAGKDELNGLEGNSNLNGGDGNDTITGTDADDIIYGGKDDDILKGLGGKDLLLGEGGNDTLVGGSGSDSLSGGKGDDTLETEYDPNSTFGGVGISDAINLVDLQEGFLFGGEGDDNFRVTGVQTAAQQFDVNAELALAESDGFSDFEVNEDFLEFV